MLQSYIDGLVNQLNPDCKSIWKMINHQNKVVNSITLPVSVCNGKIVIIDTAKSKLIFEMIKPLKWCTHSGNQLNIDEYFPINESLMGTVNINISDDDLYFFFHIDYMHQKYDGIALEDDEMPHCHFSNMKIPSHEIICDLVSEII